ncbi:DUF3450 domain-containing protein [Solimonas sp. K1W22B-7]|uniref:DUF3450 domain-containing protein n=1 Tax=Solimonas sp. K1W22B-7 TaxID=2303331 RepID=UPI0013C4FF65|nr:DUF3450 domain-containing protein [Solimonas sp. K1W22B-7]
MSTLLPAQAANLGEVKQAGEQWLAAQGDSQKRVDGLAEQGRDLANDYRTTETLANSATTWVKFVDAETARRQAVAGASP